MQSTKCIYQCIMTLEKFFQLICSANYNMAFHLYLIFMWRHALRDHAVVAGIKIPAPLSFCTQNKNADITE